MIKYYCFEDLLLTENDNEFVGYLNLYCNKDNEIKYLDLNSGLDSKYILNKFQHILQNGYASIFFKYSFFNQDYTRIWGIHHVVLCLYQHEQCSKYGTYLCKIDNKNPEIVLPFWYKNNSQFQLGDFGFVLENCQIDPETTDPFFTSCDEIVSNLKDIWKNYSSEEFDHPFFRNLFFILILSSSGNYSNCFKTDLLNTKFHISNILESATANFSNFLICFDNLICELGFTNTKQINKVEVNLVDDVGELTEAEFSELAFEITNWIESNGRVNTVKLSGEGISLKQDQEKTTHEPVNTEIQLDTTILINQNLCDFSFDDFKKLFRETCIHYAEQFFKIEKTLPLQGFYINFLEYIDANLLKQKSKIEAVQLNYLKYELLFSMAYIFSKNYVYKFLSDNFLTVINNSAAYSKELISLINTKIKCVIIFLKNKYESAYSVSPEAFQNFSTFQIVYYYLRFYSEFIVEVNIGFFIDFDKLMIEQKYKNELERISKLDLSFFYYLTENAPRQIYLIKN